MIPRIGERIRRAFRQARWLRGSPYQQTTERRDREREVKRDKAREFSLEELQEFLEGDIRPPQADPVFKEQLRADLWEMVEQKHSKDPSTKDN